MSFTNHLCIIAAVALQLFLLIDASGQCQFTITHSNSDDQCLYAEEEVVWKNTTGVLAVGNSVTKNIVSGSWDAGALSVNTVKNNGWATTVVNETNTDRIFGLSSSPAVIPGFSRAQFGIYLRSDGKFAIYESGSHKGNPTGAYGDNSYAIGDVFKIKVDRGIVKYYQNSTLLLLSTVTPSLPLTVETTLNSWSPAATIKQVKITNGSNGSFTASASSPGAGATYQWYVDGTPVANGTTYTDATLTSSNVLSCVLTTGTSGCLASGTLVSSNTITFQTVAPTTFGDYNVLNNSTEFGCMSATEPVVFTNLINTEATGNTIVKTRGLNFSIDAGAFSVNPVYNNGFVEGKVVQNNKSILLGLSSSDAGVSFGSIQFAFYARNDGQLEIYESSSQKTSLGSYSANDKLKIEVDNGVVKYYTNGTLRYISTLTPSLPLYVDASFNELDGSVSDVYVTNATIGSFTLRTTATGSTPAYQWKLNGSNSGTGLTSYNNASLLNGDAITCEVNTGLTGCAVVTTPVVNVATTTFKGTAYITTSSSAVACSETEENVTFTDKANVSVSSNTVQKILGNDGFWDAGATSLNLVYNNGYARYIASQNNTDKYFGLSSNAVSATHTSAANSTIQYAIYAASNAQYYIYEMGVYKSVTGAYAAGDQFKIKVDNGVVRYYKNNGSDILLYSSSVNPSALLPLVVDISLNTRNAVSAKLDNVVVSNGSNGIFQAVTANAGAAPAYQWKVNGSDVGTNSSTYTNAMLTAADNVTCFITPDLTGCNTNGFLSNSIVVSIVGGPLSPSTTWSGTTSSAWNNSSNWSNGVPSGYTKAIIPSGTPNSPQVNLASSGVYDLVVNSGASISITGTNTLYVFNKWNNQGTFTANSSTVNFKTCTNNRNTIITNGPETYNNISLDNANGVDVTGEHHIKTQMTLNSIVDYSGLPGDLIVFEDNATGTGVSNNGFIRGKVKKIGNDAFTFPIGKNALYRKLSITAPSSATDAFTAEYFKTSPLTVYGSTADPSFATVSGCEYWTLERIGASSVNVELSWNLASACPNPPYITNPADLRVTFWNGSSWKDGGNDGLTTGDANNGTVTSNLLISNYTAFTLASLTNLNPLPLTLVFFNAQTISGSVKLSWVTQLESNMEDFVIERADASLNFESIGTVKAAGSEIKTEYNLYDHAPLDGRNYYRLKMVDIDKGVAYSKVIAAEVESEEKLSIYPNPVKRGEVARIKKQVSRIVITDQFQRPILQIENSNEIDTQNLSAGMYFCFDENGNSFQRFIVY